MSLVVRREIIGNDNCLFGMSFVYLEGFLVDLSS